MYGSRYVRGPKEGRGTIEDEGSGRLTTRSAGILTVIRYCPALFLIIAIFVLLAVQGLIGPSKTKLTVEEACLYAFWLLVLSLLIQLAMAYFLERKSVSLSHSVGISGPRRWWYQFHHYHRTL